MNTPTDKEIPPPGSWVLRKGGQQLLENESYAAAKERLAEKLSHIQLFRTLPVAPSLNLSDVEYIIAEGLVQNELQRLELEDSDRHLIASCNHPTYLVSTKGETLVEAHGAKDVTNHTCNICGTRWRTMKDA